MSIFVLDSSLTLAFVLNDEATPQTDQILDTFTQGARAIVPALWRWEIGNALLMAERRQRITKVEARRHLALLQRLPVEIDEAAPEEAWNTTLYLAEKHQLTCYDAAYLNIALRRGAALATLDRPLRAAAIAEGVAILPE